MEREEVQLCESRQSLRVESKASQLAFEESMQSCRAAQDGLEQLEDELQQASGELRCAQEEAREQLVMRKMLQQELVSLASVSTSQTSEEHNASADLCEERDELRELAVEL